MQKKSIVPTHLFSKLKEMVQQPSTSTMSNEYWCAMTIHNLLV